jgi:hypothetical protein
MVTLLSIGSFISSYVEGGSGQGTVGEGSGHGTADDSGRQADNGGVSDDVSRGSTDCDGNAVYDSMGIDSGFGTAPDVGMSSSFFNKGRG